MLYWHQQKINLPKTNQTVSTTICASISVRALVPVWYQTRLSVSVDMCVYAHSYWAQPPKQHNPSCSSVFLGRKMNVSIHISLLIFYNSTWDQPSILHWMLNYYLGNKSRFHLNLGPTVLHYSCLICAWNYVPSHAYLWALYFAQRGDSLLCTVFIVSF